MMGALLGMGWHSLIVAATMSFGVGPEPTDTAEPSVSDPAPVRDRVFVTVPAAAEPGLLQALDAARAALQAQGLTLQVVELGPTERAGTRATSLVDEPGMLGAFWFDETRPGELRVFLVTADKVAYVRRIPVDEHGEETAREAIWIILESGSLALVSGAAPAMEAAAEEELKGSMQPAEDPPQTSTRLLPPAPERPPPQEPEPSRLRGAGLTLGYLGEGLARSIPWQSGVGVGGMLDLGNYGRVAVDYGLYVPSPGAPAIAWRHRLELRAGPRMELSPRVSVHALAGVAAEALQWRGSEDRGWRTVAVAGVDLGVVVRLVGPLSLWVEPGASAALNRFSFVECNTAAARCSGADQRVIVDPWSVRPRLRVGFSISLR